MSENGRVHPPRELDHVQEANAALAELRTARGNGAQSTLQACQGEIGYGLMLELARLSGVLERGERREVAAAKAKAQRRRFPRLLKGRFT